VYASADEGATFTEVASHLPDVLSVRAAVVVGNREGMAAPLAAAEATVLAEAAEIVEAAAQTTGTPEDQPDAPVPG
jgi:secreted protein with Ig-like and vWFA domain